MNKNSKECAEAQKLCNDFYNWIVQTGRTNATVSLYKEKREILHQANADKYPLLSNRDAFTIRRTINGHSFKRLRMNGYTRNSNGQIEIVYSII